MGPDSLAEGAGPREAPHGGEDFWSRASRAHKELALGSAMLVQTQKGSTKGKWESSVTAMDILEHNSYLVMRDGSWWLSKRRRSFLKPLVA